MEEKTFFDDVKVTNSRFISGSQTYAMSNITSAKAYEKKPNRLFGTYQRNYLDKVVSALNQAIVCRG